MSQPEHGKIYEGYARAMKELLRVFFKSTENTIEINEVEFTFPADVAIEFTRERLDAGEKVIAFIGERLKDGPRHKCNAFTNDDPHPYAYEQWSNVDQVVYVKVSNHKGENDKNFREAVRIYDLLVLVLDVYSAQAFKDKNIRHVRLASVPINQSGTEFSVLAGRLTCQIATRFEPSPLPTP